MTGHFTKIAMLLVALVGFSAAASAQALWKKEDPNAGSIYKFHREAPREYKKHDLILVRIKESTISRVSDEFESNSEFTAEVDIPTLPKNNGPTVAETFATDIETTLENQKDAERARRSQFSDIVTAEIVEIMPGYDVKKGIGQAKIRAVKTRIMGGETERVMLTGRVEFKHINKTDDSISADYIFNPVISYVGEGDISGNTKQGWFSKVLSWAWPF